MPQKVPKHIVRLLLLLVASWRGSAVGRPRPNATLKFTPFVWPIYRQDRTAAFFHCVWPESTRSGIFDDRIATDRRPKAAVESFVR
jgi:hypothetical protein